MVIEMMNQNLFEKLIESLDKRKEVYLLTIINHPDSHLLSQKALLWNDGDIYTEALLSPAFIRKLNENCKKLLIKKQSGTISFQWNEGIVECFIEFFPVPVRLIVAGAGHVCEPVVEMGKMLGFFVTVIDDRTEFANRKRFPNSDQVICQSYFQFFKEVEITSETYILLLTRGHKYDVLSLKELLRREKKPAYIGMIGSRRRISGVFEELRQDFPDESFDHIYTPVGLDIGAETPSEIAVSIMAEILKLKNQKSGSSLSKNIKKYAKLGFREGAAQWNR